MSEAFIYIGVFIAGTIFGIILMIAYIKYLAAISSDI